MSQSTTVRPAARPARPQAVLEVRRRERLSVHTVRLVVGGPGFAQFRDNEFTDKYAKIVFVAPDLGLEPPYDLAELRHTLAPELRPVTRTYTVRRVDADAQQVTIDFVTHGDHGLAAPWASRAKTGDVIVLSGAGGAYRPAPDADWQLFIGDESALPAICSALESLPGDARGIAYLETCDDAEYLDAEPPAEIELRWLHRDQPGSRPDLLADAVRAGPWLPGVADVFAHGERESMKAVRAALKERLGAADHLSLSGYWAAGRTEDAFQSEKRLPIGQLG